MDRRNFIKSALATVTAVSLTPSFKFAQQTKKRVIVLGAGLAGMSAAWELEKSGFDVVILEARARAGGRVYTLREPFSDGLHAEAGASRIQDTHKFTLQYAKEFNLEMVPFFPSEGNNITYIKGKRIPVAAGKLVNLSDLPLRFTDEEIKLGLGGSLGKYLFSHLGELGDTTKADWSANPALAKFEKNLPDFAREAGASEGVIQMLGFGHDLSKMSALQLLRDVQLTVNTKQFFKIREGSDLLPKALAAKLADKIYYGTPVVRMEQDEKSVKVVYLQSGVPQAITGDYLVCTIPLPVLRKVEIVSPLSKEKAAAIKEIDYLPMARVHLQSRKRFWLARGENGFANADDPMEVWDYSRDQQGTRGILGAYTSGKTALFLTEKTHEERGKAMLEMMERVHPGIRENFEVAASHSWVNDPWSLGAAANFEAGQFMKFDRFLGMSEGRFHFAGDHTSPWNGWMNGALESGNRAAAEIKSR